MVGVSGLVIVVKLILKFMVKIGVKFGVKVGGKFFVKIGIVLSGFWICGFFVFVCIIGFWFGSDVVFNYIDEWFYRDDFKKEILNNINEVKENFKNSYK